MVFTALASHARSIHVLAPSKPRGRSYSLWYLKCYYLSRGVLFALYVRPDKFAIVLLDDRQSVFNNPVNIEHESLQLTFLL